jgi:hypothetical protein
MTIRAGENFTGPGALIGNIEPIFIGSDASFSNGDYYPAVDMGSIISWAQFSR